MSTYNPYDDYENNFLPPEGGRFSGVGGLNDLSPLSDTVVQKKSTKVSSSPIGERLVTPPDSFGKAMGGFSPYNWDQTSSSPGNGNHMTAIFGFSSNTSLPGSGASSLSQSLNESSIFSFNPMREGLDDIIRTAFDKPTQNSFSHSQASSLSRMTPKSPVPFGTPPDDDEDGFSGMDPMSGYPGSLQNSLLDEPLGQSPLPTDPAFLQNGFPDPFTPSTFGEHPLGEHPSRTLFVRNINSNVEDDELNTLFEQYGPIRNMYTQCKHRGFVMISYYDIRHAKNAMRYLQGKVLRRRKLDIHYSIPKDNPSEKDQNQGTLVVFNLDPATTNDELKIIFGSFGEIKEIRETPNKKHHKFIEFYDIRDADRAMRALNKTDIKGKKIKIEPSRPGGARRTAPSTTTPFADQPQSFPNSFSEEELQAPHSLPYMSNDSVGFLNGGHTNGHPYPTATSYPPPQQQLPKYVHHPIGPMSPPSVQNMLRGTGANRPRSRSVTAPYDEEPISPAMMNSGVSPVIRSSSSSSLPSIWVPHEVSPSPRSLTPTPADARARALSPIPQHNAYSISPSEQNLGGLMLPKSDGQPADGNITPRRHRSYSTEEDRSKFIIDIPRVRAKQDNRTTVMIKNIPNKYSQKMLLASIDERHKGTYDFFYLPIDFKNKCNVGYAFINFVAIDCIPSFYEEFNNKKWEKFNSEKVCEITYARIQGKIALISHFQNSSLMCEDKKCRPIIFHSDGPNAGEQEPFPIGLSPRRPRSYSNSSKEDDSR